MQAPFLGRMTADIRPLCIDNEGKRRKDIKQKYGGGVPECKYEEHNWEYGLAQEHKHPTENIPTPQGPICIRFGGSRMTQRFIPTSGELDAAPYVDTRMRALSDRYYK